MLAFLQYLIALLIAEHVPAGQGPYPPRIDPGAAAATIVVFAILAVIVGRRSLVQARTRGDAAATQVLSRTGTLRVVALAAFYVLMQHQGGRSIAHRLGVHDWVLVPTLVRLLPYFGLTLIARLALHPAQRLLGLVPPSFVRSLTTDARQALLPLMPILVVLGGWGLLVALLGRLQTTTTGRFAALVLTELEVVQVGLALGLVFFSLLALPFVLRLAWRAYPMPPGPLRTRLDAYAQSIGLQARDILIWPSDGAYVNAAVIGALPRFRYVVVTDGLMESLQHDEIEAVFAHEAGHAKRGHVLLFFGFTAVLVLASLLPQGLALVEMTGLDKVDPLLRSGLTVVIWVGVIFGWVSRRFEQEADVFGIDTLPRPARESAVDGAAVDGEEGEHPFVRALERIAEQLGGIREVTGWRHFSIADRVTFVKDYLADGQVRARYRRGIRLLRGTLIGMISVFVILAASRVPAEIERGKQIWQRLHDTDRQMLGALAQATATAGPARRGALFAAAAMAAEDNERPEEALRWFREAAHLLPANIDVLERYAVALEAAGKPRGALLAWREVHGSAVADEPRKAHANRQIERLEALVADR